MGKAKRCKHMAKVINDAGGVGSFAVDDMTRVRRFLILGAEGGTYYISERKLQLDNAQALVRLLESGRGQDVVAEAVAVSLEGRAAKQSPTLFVLAACARLGDEETRRAVFLALPSVARTPTMLFEYIGLSMAIKPDGKGWGRGLRRAVAAIYAQDAAKLAMHVTKYRSRESFTHRDVLRLAHCKPHTAAHDLVLNYAVKGELRSLDDGADAPTAAVHAFLSAVESAKFIGEGGDDAHGADDAIVGLVKGHGLVREHIPSPLLSSVKVWRALLERMPLAAMVRNLGKMSNIGVFTPLSDTTRAVCARLRDPAALRKARVHPFAVFLALRTYASGRGVRGKLTWVPEQMIVDALDAAFHTTFAHVKSTGKRFVLALDVSGSMSWGEVNGAPGVTPREAAAAMCMVTLRTEPCTHTLAFTNKLKPLDLRASMSLSDITRATSSLPFGATDCAQPMLWALRHKVEADVFVVYTDSETWAGAATPVDALRDYREATGINAKLIVVAMQSNGFSLADPNDAGMLDIVGFDANAPAVMREFVLGNV